MNYFAHIFLSNKDPDHMFGNFIGDLISVADIPFLSRRIQLGIELHRKIDVWTDTHPSNQAVVEMLRDKHGPYSPVIADIAYDYFLWKHWKQYSEEPADQYLDWVYTQLNKFYQIYHHLLPTFVGDMLQNKWLTVYSDLEGLHRVFERMKKRVSKPQYFNGCAETIANIESLIDPHFLILFSDLIKRCAILQSEMKE